MILDDTNNSLLSDPFFTSQMLNAMPGIFYLYELKDDSAYLKVWNKNHSQVTGYTDKELLNKEVLDFIDESTRPIVKKAIEKIVRTGSAKGVYANILIKSGEVIPYVFEGYLFKKNGTHFFMGIGLDISELVHSKQKIERLEIQKRQKEKELFSIALQEQKKEELLQDVLLKLEDLEGGLNKTGQVKAIRSLQQEIKNQFIFNDSWVGFKKIFEEVHANFFHNLIKKHPNLTKGELQYCAYLKIQMPASELCNILNISKEGLIKKRYRLRKKLSLEKDLNLDTYIFSI